MVCSKCQLTEATLESLPTDITLEAGETSFFWVKPNVLHPADLVITVKPQDQRFKEAVVFKVDLGIVMLFGTNPELFDSSSIVTITLNSSSA
jgi:hypothetical protein